MAGQNILLGSARLDTGMPGSRVVWTAHLRMLHPPAPRQTRLLSDFKVQTGLSCPVQVVFHGILSRVALTSSRAGLHHA